MRTTVIVLTSAACLLGIGVHAQDAPSFEVASVRRNVTDGHYGGGLATPQPGGRFVGVGVTLKRLIADAYGGRPIVGGPPWLETDRFDINARASGDRSPAQIFEMLKPLLAERFKLLCHTESRDMPVYVMSAVRPDGKLGPKLRESDVKCSDEARNYFPRAAPRDPPPCGDFRLGARTFTARGMTMSGLADVLRGRVGRAVIDRTGLTAAYDFDIEWSSDLGLQQAPPDSAGASALTADGISLFTAFQEQLGLRLQSARVPVEVIVVDSAQPPTPD
jgi:uncharacterized protein (TIGR03435 family)